MYYGNRKKQVKCSLLSEQILIMTVKMIFPEGKKITWKKGSHYTALELNMQARKVGRVGVHAQTYAA